MRDNKNVLMTSIYLHERSWEGVQENLKTNDTVLIPLGTTENHGAHCTLMTDMCWALGICEGVAKETGTIIGPPVYVGYSRGHLAYPGPLNLRAETFSNLIIDIARSMIYHGYRRIVLVNGHRVSNLAPILEAGNHLHHRYGVPVGIIDAGLIAIKDVNKIVHQPKGAEHGGDAETSMVLAYRPELVDMSKAGTQPPCPKGDDVWDYMTQQIMLMAPKEDTKESRADVASPAYGQEVCEMATSQYATAEKGKQVWDVTIKNAVAAVKEFRKRKIYLRNMEDVYPI